jgi:hypothetical protein
MLVLQKDAHNSNYRIAIGALILVKNRQSSFLKLPKKNSENYQGGCDSE